MPIGAMLVRTANAIDRIVDSVCGAVLAVSGIALTLILGAVVVLRYVFHSGITASVEITELSFALFVMAGIALAARHGAHVTTRLTLAALKGRARLALALVIHAATIAVYLLLAWYTYENALIAHDQHTPVLGIPYSVGYGILAGGLVLIALSSLVAIVKLTVGGEEVPLESADLGGSAA
jgi:TRAP-type C4-dicarboxylate transport system permease small subunit